MRIGRRIGLGYGTVIAVTLIVGAISMIGMRSARKGMERLDSTFLPAMANGSEVERSAWTLFFHMRGYGYSYDEKDMEDARKAYAEVQQASRDGAEMAKMNGVEDLSGPLAHYGELMDETEKAINAMLGQRGPLAKAQEEFVTSCREYLDDQKVDLENGVKQRQASIVLAQGIVQSGTQARVLSFEAQSSNNYSLFEKAKAELADVYAKADQLEANAEGVDEIASIDEIRSAAKAYENAIQGYYDQVSDEEDIDVMAMMESRQEMEASAAKFSGATQDFLAEQNAALEETVTTRLARVAEATAVLDQGNEIVNENLLAQVERDMALMAEAVEQFETVYEGVAALRAQAIDETDLETLSGIEFGAKAYQSAMRNYLQAWTQLENAAKDRDETYQHVIQTAQEMAAVGMDKALENSAENSGNLQRISSIAFIFMVVATLGAAVAAFLGVRKITGALRALVEQLNTSAGSVSTASAQVSEASQELAEGSSQQAASVEETSSSLEELASMTRQNAEHANTANSTVQSTAEVVEEATQAMNELTASMGEIAAGSKETQKIIKTIDEIAFQTNLLALNAAVEAARAGEAGAGFAVVADEVRNLAIRAAEAARNTAGLIEGSVKKIDVGASLLERTNDAFQRVSVQTGEVRNLISNIATASGEQSNGIEQINKAVSEMDRVVQRNASGAEETASAASELGSQAGNLDLVVEQLNALLDGGSNGGPVAGGPSSVDDYGQGVVNEDEFSFDMPTSGASVPSAPKGGSKKVKTSSSSAASASAASSNSGVIRDSEMSHDDFDFDDSDFNFDDDSFDSPKR